MSIGASTLDLEDAYHEAFQGWPVDSFGFLLDAESFDDAEDFGDAGVDGHARAGVEDASTHGLVGRLQDAGSGLAESPSLACTLDLLRAADRLASWAAAQRARLVARVHTFSHPDHHSWSGPASSLAFTETVAETAALLKLSEGSAARLVSESLTLTNPLTATLAALERGGICASRASVIVEQSRTLPDEAVLAFEAEILAVAEDLNRPRLTARCRRLREKLHPESLTARRVKAASDRCVAFEPDRDGMAWFSAYLPAEQALALHTTVDAVARTLRSGDDPRTLPQLRADVLADMLLGAGGPSGARSPAARIVVTVPVFSLMGITDEPAELEGYGPIPADAARRLAGSPGTLPRGCACSPTRTRVRCSAWTGPGTARARTCGCGCSSARRPAASTAVPVPPAAAIWTTWCPGPTEDRPVRTISIPPAGGTTC